MPLLTNYFMGIDIGDGTIDNLSCLVVMNSDKLVIYQTLICDKKQFKEEVNRVKKFYNIPSENILIVKHNINKRSVYTTDFHAELLEGWQSGRMRQSRKLLAVTGPGVRISHPPPGINV